MTDTYSQNLGYWIKRYSLLVNREMDATLKLYGIGRTQWYILFHIHKEGAIAQRKLQNILQIKSATLTALITSLVKKDLVTQSLDVTDKRGKTVYLTPNGSQLWKTLPDPISAVRSRAHKGISNEELERTRLVIERAVNNLEEEQ